MLESVTDHPWPAAEKDLKQKMALIESYFAATNGFLDLYSRAELLALLPQTNNALDAPNERTAALYIAIAIGGQCRASGPLDLQYSREYFSLGQQAAFLGMVEDPSLTLTRCFILMAFYMLGACRRNAAFMYLGIAAKSAYAIGLHVTEHYASTEEDERSAHASTWRSLRVMDITLSALLGRLSGTLPNVAEPETFDSSVMESMSLHQVYQDAMYGAAIIMDDIFHGLLRTKSIDTVRAEEYLHKLNVWSASLPADLRKFSRTTPLLQSDQELVLGKIHVAGLYYWTVMLVTRPFLFFTMTLSSKQASIPASYNQQALAEITTMSQVCVSAAIYFAQMCQQALEPGSLLNNMCMLKGWTYSAGLVLGFSMVVSDHVRYDVEEAFASAREVLQKLSSSSPQSEHYYDVLSRLADAIAKYRQRRASESRQKHPELVTELLTFESGANTSTVDLLGSQTQPKSPSALAGNIQQLDASHGFGNASTAHTTSNPIGSHSVPGHSGHMMDPTGVPTYENLHGARMDFDTGDADGSWEAFAMQLSQTFPFDSGLEQLFQDV
ncbi:hypothetical protein LTR85_009099 [Meristemomyces frigidus]|nr:hypothetical protein LTR85_009099 [Meristemomyces frigidus]